MIEALAAQFEVTRAEMRDQFEATGALIIAEGEKTREHTTAEHEATRDEMRAAVAGMGKEVLREIEELLKAQSRSAPPIRSRIWEVPHHWSRFFVGRDTLLARIHDEFAANPYPVALVQAIQGLGGVGKTQTAVHYAYRYSAEYTGVWWLPSESAATLAVRYAALADRLELRVAESGNQQQRIEAVRNYLEGTEETGERWLLIFDNAVPTFGPDDVRHALHDYLPCRGKCDVLITSREKAWRHIAEEQDVYVLAEDDAVRFLMERTEDRNKETARELARELGCLPLALEQAGAYIDESQGQQTLASYLTLFRRMPLEHLTVDRAKVGEYGEAVATTWFISFDAAERQSPAAGDLLRLCAFLDPNRVPLGDLIAHADKLPSRLSTALRDPEAGPTAVSMLLRYSLAEAAGSGLLNTHRLVQLVVREWLANEEFEAWLMAALMVINAAFPSDTGDPQQWEVCARLVAHAQAVLWHVDRASLTPGTAGRLLNQIGLYLQRRGLFADAQEALERALAIDEAVHGPDHPDVATGLNNLAGVLQDQGDYAGARERYERALAIAEAVHGPDHPVVAIGLSNLAGVLQVQGDYAGARERYERALAIMEATFEPNHPNLATALSNLAGVLRVQGDYAGARERFERALAIAEAVHGPDHPDVAIGLSNLAGVLRVQGDYAGARERYERALAIAEAVHGPDHPDVAIGLSNLAGVLQDQGDYAGARERYERALAIAEAVHGPDHPDVATRLNNLAGVLQVQGDYAGARERFERALAIAEAVHGPDHPDVAIGLSNLAGVLRVQGDYAGARERYERALAIMEATFEPNHPNLATALSNLALVLRVQGDYAGARERYERALAIDEAVHGPDHPDVAIGLSNLAGVLEQTGDFITSVRLLWRTLAFQQRQSPSYGEGMTFYRLGRLAVAMERPEVALRLLATTYAIDHQIAHADAVRQVLPILRQGAEAFGMNEDDLKALLSEASDGYRKDRGHGLLAAAFPELSVKT